RPLWQGCPPLALPALPAAHSIVPPRPKPLRRQGYQGLCRAGHSMFNVRRESTMPSRMFAIVGLLAGLWVLGGCSDQGPGSAGHGTSGQSAVTLLNVSYDPTR